MTIHVDYGQLPEQSSPKNGKIANVDNAGLKPSKWSSTAVSRRRGLARLCISQARATPAPFRQFNLSHVMQKFSCILYMTGWGRIRI